MWKRTGPNVQEKENAMGVLASVRAMQGTAGKHVVKKCVQGTATGMVNVIPSVACVSAIEVMVGLRVTSVLVLLQPLMLNVLVTDFAMQMMGNVCAAGHLAQKTAASKHVLRIVQAREHVILIQGSAHVSLVIRVLDVIIKLALPN